MKLVSPDRLLASPLAARSWESKDSQIIDFQGACDAYLAKQAAAQ
ncbi:hypothetical protein [Pseudoalteromonas rubra]|nr:hypothetical protein [Pseudoalteromonas rubra]